MSLTDLIASSKSNLIIAHSISISHTDISYVIHEIVKQLDLSISVDSSNGDILVLKLSTDITIFIIGFGVTSEDIQAISELGEATLAYVTSLNYNNNISYYVYESDITADHLEYIEIQQLIDPSQFNIGKTLNVGYPIERHKSITPNKEILRLSPKLDQLLTNINLYDGDRHVIYTKYTGLCGIQLIESYLNAYKFNPINDDVDKFNSISNDGILLTSNTLLSPNNVQHLHIFDTIDNNNLIKLILNIYNYNNYTTVYPNLNVHFYITLTPIASNDAISYGINKEYINRCVDIWSEICDSSYSVSIID